MLLKITEHFIELNVSDYIKVYYIVLPFEPEYVQGCATATCPQFVRDIKFYLPSLQSWVSAAHAVANSVSLTSSMQSIVKIKIER